MRSPDHSSSVPRIPDRSEEFPRLLPDPAGEVESPRHPQSKAADTVRRRSRLIGSAVVVAAGTTTLILAAATYLRIQPIYQLAVTVQCELPDGGESIPHQEIVRALQSPPAAMLGEVRASSWPFGQLLSIGRVQFEPDASQSAISIKVESAKPDVARELCDTWLEDRLSSIGKDPLSEHIDEALASMRPTSDVPAGTREEYAAAVSDLARMRDLLSEQQRAQSQTASDLEALRKAPPSDVDVSREEKEQALSDDVELQQDLAQLRTVCSRLLVELERNLERTLESCSQLDPGLSTLMFIIGEMQQRPAGDDVVRMLPELSAFTDDFQESQEKLRELLAGARESLKSLSAEDAETLLGLCARIDAEAMVWSESSLSRLAEQIRAVDGLGEGQETSVKRILIQSRLKRALWALQFSSKRFSEVLAGLQRDWNVQLAANSKSGTGLLRRIRMKRQHIAEKLQVDAEERARRERLKKIQSLEEELENSRQAEHDAVGALLLGFETVLSMEDDAMDRTIYEHRSVLLRDIQNRLGRITRDPLRGIELTRGPVQVDDEPTNTAHRLKWSAIAGGGGGAACLVILCFLNLIRRAWGRESRVA